MAKIDQKLMRINTVAVSVNVSALIINPSDNHSKWLQHLVMHPHLGKL